MILEVFVCDIGCVLEGYQNNAIFHSVFGQPRSKTKDLVDKSAIENFTKMF